MVLEKLSTSLKSTLQKIAKSMFVDEKLINELVKDIQRALLQADVNVKLVLELTNNIKERITKEETPGALTKKEHLVNIVYEELTKFLGGEKSELKLGDKKPNKIILIGLFGSGKCVHRDTNVMLWNGQTINIEKLYNAYKSRGEFSVEDGYVIQLVNDLFVPSFNPETLKVEKKRVTDLWKLCKNELVQVDLDNGNNFSIKTTPEHPFFVIKKGQAHKVRADNLKVGDFVAVPNEFGTEHNSCDFLGKLQKLNIDVRVGGDTEIIKESILLKHETLRNALNSLPYKRNYAKFTHLLKKGQVPLYFFDLNTEKLEIKSHKAQDWISFPSKLTPEFSEFIGYIIGDGYLSKKSVHISTADDEIIDRIRYLSRTLFNLKPLLTPDKRSKAINLRLNSTTLVHCIHELFNIPIGKKGPLLEIPQIIQEASLDHIKLFIRAYFDCDGHFAPNTRSIEIISESELLIRQLHHMLLRCNLFGTQSKKQIKNKFYYRFFLQARSAEGYAKEIGSLIERKRRALSKYALISLKQGDGKKDMIPVGNLLKELRLSRGYTIGQIQKKVSSYGLYEGKGRISKSQLRKLIAFYERTEKGNAASFLEMLNNTEVRNLGISTGLNIGLVNALIGEFKNKNLIAEVVNSPKKLVLTNKGKKYLEKQRSKDSEGIYDTLKYLAFANVSWIKVKKIQRIKNEHKYVYDLTVEDNHSFIADGIVVHNTTTSGKLAKYFMKRGKKVALLGLDVHRPAAMDQLEQIGKQINATVLVKKGEKDPVKIYKHFEPEYEKYDLILIDTAGRDALSQDLLDELKTVHDLATPDESLLIISADIGQAAQQQASAFHEAGAITGVIVTKMDGTAKGGGALSACSVTQAPIKFLGVGERVDDLESFNPKGFVGRLLGMGDLEALLEKAKEAITEEEAKDMEKKLLKGEFNLIDLYQQMEAMTKMGPLGKVLEMIPGMGQISLPKDALQVQEGKLKKWKYAMSSMTKHELEDPENIDAERIDRISDGSGIPTGEIRDLIKQYKQSKKLVKMLKGENPEKLMKKLSRKQGPKLKF